MSPITTSTLDNFNRPDADNLGPNWAHSGFYGASQRLHLEDNAAVCPPLEGPLMEWWTPQIFGPDVELRLDVTGISGTVKVYVRIVDPYPGDPVDEWPPGWDMLGQGGYTHEWNLALGEPINGIRIRAEGSTITRSERVASTGAWSDATETDTTYPDAGYIGFSLDGSAAAASSSVGEAGGGGEEPIPPGPIDIGHRLLR